MDSPWPRARAMATSSGLRHSSIRNFTRVEGHRKRASPKPLEYANGVVSSVAGLAPDRPAHKSSEANTIGIELRIGLDDRCRPIAVRQHVSDIVHRDAGSLEDWGSAE